MITNIQLKKEIEIIDQRTLAVLAMVNVLSASLISKGVLDYDQYEKYLKKEVQDLMEKNNDQ